MNRVGSVIAGLALVGASIGVVWSDERDHLCRPGYAASVRPSMADSHRLKMHLCEIHGIPWEYCGPGWRLDHIIPLELGGDPVADSNLQLQPTAESHVKDLRENEARREFCNGHITLLQAQNRFRPD